MMTAGRGRWPSFQDVVQATKKNKKYYPLVNVYSLLLKIAIEIVDLPIKNGDFP